MPRHQNHGAGQLALFDIALKRLGQAPQPLGREVDVFRRRRRQSLRPGGVDCDSKPDPDQQLSAGLEMHEVTSLGPHGIGSAMLTTETRRREETPKTILANVLMILATGGAPGAPSRLR